MSTPRRAGRVQSRGLARGCPPATRMQWWCKRVAGQLRAAWRTLLRVCPWALLMVMAQAGRTGNWVRLNLNGKSALLEIKEMRGMKRCCPLWRSWPVKMVPCGTSEGWRVTQRVAAWLLMPLTHLQPVLTDVIQPEARAVHHAEVRVQVAEQHHRHAGFQHQSAKCKHAK